jgi:hypothetical protein
MLITERSSGKEISTAGVELTRTPEVFKDGNVKSTSPFEKVIVTIC